MRVGGRWSVLELLGIALLVVAGVLLLSAVAPAPDLVTDSEGWQVAVALSLRGLGLLMILGAGYLLARRHRGADPTD
ncbi:hypothetical protein [Thalassiella azotivora]